MRFLKAFPAQQLQNERQNQMRKILCFLILILIIPVISFADDDKISIKGAQLSLGMPKAEIAKVFELKPMNQEISESGYWFGSSSVGGELLGYMLFYEDKLAKISVSRGDHKSADAYELGKSMYDVFDYALKSGEQIINIRTRESHTPDGTLYYVTFEFPHRSVELVTHDQPGTGKSGKIQETLSN
jgi:hypothetical protein